MRDEAGKERLRACRFLAGGPASVGAVSRPDMLLLEAGPKGTMAFRRATIAAMASDGLVERLAGEVRLTPAGEAYLRRSLADAEPFAGQHREIVVETMPTSAGTESVAINLAESPLAQLARRRDKSGRPFLDHREVSAGERLRTDYTRGQIMPRLSANWEASVSSGRRDGGAAGITETALSARMRVEKALVAVGPELSGVLVDVCCFLKGLELVEAERGWPVRSAKIVLKTALGVLGRHYEPPNERQRGRPAVLHWGAEDFRPGMHGPAGASSSG